VIPDAEQIITAHLKADADVVAITDRIKGQTPSTLAEPWVRITLLDDSATDGGVTDHAIAAFVQIDCFAGTAAANTAESQRRASLLSRTVRESLRTANLLPHDGAAISGADLHRAHQLDPDHEPAMHYYSITGTVWMHSA
jgi:hypothetical protein